MTTPDPEWTITESGFDPARASYYETIFTVGNGRLGTRGTLEEGHLGALSGTYLAGVYDSHDAAVIDLVNAPDWLDTVVWCDGVRLDVDTAEVVEHERTLDLRTGLLRRTTVFADPAGRRVRLETVRLASMADRDLCGLQVTVTPLDHDAEIEVVTGIDAHRRNLDRLPYYPDGLALPPQQRWEKWARSTHLQVQERGFEPDGVGYVVADTIAGGIRIAYAFTVSSTVEPEKHGTLVEYERVAQRLRFQVAAGSTVGIDKLVAVATSRDPGTEGNPLHRALATLAAHRDGGFAAAARASEQAWEQLWKASAVRVVGHDDAAAKDATALNFGVYHLLIAANPDDPTVSIGAKSLSGEGYRGHVFWDSEIMLLPFYLYTNPAAARSLLSYRHHTLPGARAVAAENGTEGARYAWESADTGLEECPQWTPDGKDRFWTREEEVHVTADVAYAIGEYLAATGDEQFLLDAGAEILFDTSRFWVSRLEAADDGTLGFSNVMGPDEFHSHISDNAFTNRMVRLHLDEAVATHERLAESHPDRLAEIATGLGLTREEVASWADAAGRIRTVTGRDPGVIEQFDGYFDLLDVPIESWDANDMPRYPTGYNHFNCEDTKLLKQPDAVMLLYLLPDEYSKESQRENFEYYEARTLHKSSLSPSIHAIVGLQVGDPTRAVQYFERSAYVDLDDNQGNTADGMHIASAAGTWQVAVHGFGGMRVLGGKLTFAPRLPQRWDRLQFAVQWRGDVVDADLGHTESTFTLRAAPGTTQEIVVDGEPVVLVADEPVTVATPDDGPAPTEQPTEKQSIPANS